MDTQYPYSVNSDGFGQYTQHRLTEGKDPQISYGLSPRRYILLILVMLSYLTNQVGYFLNNIGTPDYLFYFALLFFLPFFASSVNWIEGWGIQRTLILALLLQGIGIWLGKCLWILQPDSETVPVIGPTVGEMINSCAQVYMLNFITKFTGLWFGVRGRILATGLLLSAYYEGWYLVNWLIYPIENIDDLMNFVTAFWYGIAVFSFVILIVVAFVFKAQPDDCPTFSQGVMRRKEFNFKEDLQQLVQDPLLRKALILCAVLLTYCYCSPYGFYWYQFTYTSSLMDYYAPPCYVGGILLFVILLIRNFDYKKLFIFCLIANLIALIILEVAYQIENEVMVYIGYFPQVIFIGGLRLLVYEFITEVSFPISPALTIGALHCFSNLLTLAITIVSDTFGAAYYEEDSNPFMHTVEFAYMAVLLGAAIVIWKLDFKLKRLDFDLQNNSSWT